MTCLYQGVLKHLKEWVINVFGPVEIDACCCISSLSRITGQEHNDISRFLLSIIIDIPLPGVLATPLQTDKTLTIYQNALEQFHANKQIFADLGVCKDFCLSKLHFLNHYVNKCKFIGTYDNTNPEYMEQFHIDLARDAYCATNHKDEYPQMTLAGAQGEGDVTCELPGLGA
ncbi:hypothetical protein BT96DRAFT_956626 [Gymnopus androsaceus JB14]|uniref:Uncharacterized protein n=1 Tax=Gymnopus androsaceus JB14 TaxID=1447944 RepID=A0A6A4HTR0_9AGAR|nr:hypothetical protein BT96DRAFT_956626 [Gymnopus androsaceus JB14]